MNRTTKIANLLLSEEQANKDLAFSIIESLGVDFGEVCEEIRKALLDSSKKSKVTDITILGFDITSYDTQKGLDVWQINTERSPNLGIIIPMYNLLYDGSLSRSSNYDSIDFFIQKIKQAYNETKQSNNHNQ